MWATPTVEGVTLKMELDTGSANEIKEVHDIDQKKTGEVIKELQNKYKDVFKDELGTIKGIKAKLSLKDNSSPKYIKARTVPFSLRAKLEAELDRLEKEGTLNNVQHSEWASPIVPVLKKNGNVRICGDFKVTLNPMLNVDQYPLPKIDDIFANLNGGIQQHDYYWINRRRTLEQFRLNQYGLRANLDKCEFFKDSVIFCGHVIDKHGLHKTPDKIEAIKNAPAPENVSQLKSVLGLINYYAKLLPDLSATLSPLHYLLRKDTTWEWTKECQEAFDKVKDLVTSDMILTHFNPELSVTQACDASPYGLGAVISHRYPNGSDRPIAFASRSFAPAEKNYSQIDKEALGNFGELRNSIPTCTGYEYEIEFRGTAKHANADSLSRLPLKSTEVDTSLKMVESFHIAQMEAIPISNKQVQQETRNDRVLGLITTFTQDGWNTIHKADEYAPYHSRRNELTVHQGCLMWGVRVIIPSKLRSQVSDKSTKDILVSLK
ncbi:unnamed protein product [Mytilus coruscus]|uniref:Reverse transcriptase/retrotransposon-derived protein RNase H-like domain-containing protein n=1 Tax=Mytilus coruscus TaxID=42192 RepID=A0A6J8AX50_MYTCO|nr:unnamed protein product [Mytilus coruscus]